MNSPSENYYKPRNIINAPEIKIEILKRSQQRGDDEIVQRWLTNHFYRWCISDFPRVSLISSEIDYFTYFGVDAPIPDWLVSQIASKTPCYYFNPQHTQLIDKERELVEFLSRHINSKLAKKLQRINCFAALAMREAEHKKMLQRQQQGWHPTSSVVLKPIIKVSTGEIVEFDANNAKLRREMAYESWHMQHCLGQFEDKAALIGGYGDYYAQQIEQGMLRLFSLRDENNIPHATISMKIDNGSLAIDQIKGKQNRPPIKKYAADILSLLCHLNPQSVRHADCEGMGIVYEDTAESQGWKFITNIQSQNFLLSVLHDHFHLLEHFPAPPIALQWLLLHSAPDKLHYLQAVDPVVATAAEMLYPKQPWHPLFAGKNSDSAPFKIENVTLHATRYLATAKEQS
ncbi:PcfJ domain-containing protein [Serratia sp. DD3]|uniref:PcfJ domain-containing protein n=1 Tax=Serratia sp. DD3 TaxID=1410619 RepID=UPI0003C50A4B|nr:PcfJ domain-containing protein [Serratia sp. DD3]KEY60658.1 hypothetical protein SRDD_05560 [Serratia sp. DD3]